MVPFSYFVSLVKILNFQLLVDWTKGKNLIFSSAAPAITELRGPYDVANLMTLLGITMERAKAAISKNCRYVKCEVSGCVVYNYFCCVDLCHSLISDDMQITYS